MAAPRFFVQNFGCRATQADGAALEAQFAGRGLGLAESREAADIVIATAPKCGTTWTQQICSLLVFQSAEPREIQTISPWIDFRLPKIEAVMAAIEAQSHRRFLKAHLPFDAMPIYDEVRYIHVARDGRDAFMSWHNHTSHYSQAAIDNQSAAGQADETIARPLPRPE